MKLRKILPDPPVAGGEPYIADWDLTVKDCHDKDIALKVYEQKYNQLRHLDVLRWQVPGLVGTLGVAILGFGTKEGGSVPPTVLGGYGTFALLCAYFLFRLIGYIKANTNVLRAVGKLLGDETVPHPPIWYKSTAAWFAVLMVVVGAASLLFGMYGFARG